MKKRLSAPPTGAWSSRLASRRTPQKILFYLFISLFVSLFVVI